MAPKTDTQKFRIQQQLEDREAELERKIADMQRRHELDVLIQPFQDEIQEIHQQLQGENA